MQEQRERRLQLLLLLLRKPVETPQTSAHLSARLDPGVRSAAREVYRPVAARGSLVYFLIDNLNALDRVYHYSMANYVYILKKGMDLTPGGKDEEAVPSDQRLGEEVSVVSGGRGGGAAARGAEPSWRRGIAAAGGGPDARRGGQQAVGEAPGPCGRGAAACCCRAAGGPTKGV